MHPRAPLKPLTWYKKLATKKGRLTAGAFLVEGDRAMQQIMRSQPQAVLEILSADQSVPPDRHDARRYVTANQFRTICHTKTPQGTLAVVRLPLETYSEQVPPACGNKILLLEDIQDPGNVGTLIRTAAAFGFSGVILTEKCADPFSPKCVQATAGSVLSVWLRKTPHYLAVAQALQHRGYDLVAADLSGADDPADLCGRAMLLLALGNEASGLSEALLSLSQSRCHISIDSASAESLNVAACGAICMYLSSQRR